MDYTTLRTPSSHDFNRIDILCLVQRKWIEQPQQPHSKIEIYGETFYGRYTALNTSYIVKANIFSNRCVLVLNA